MGDTADEITGAVRRKRRLFGLDSMQRYWLLYLLFWFIVPSEYGEARFWVFLGIACAVFILLFVLVHGHYGLRTRRWAVAGMMVLGLIYVPINLSALGVYIYVATALVEIVTDARTFRLLLGAEALLIFLQAWVLHLPLWEWSIAIIVSVLTGMSAMHHTVQRRANARLQLAHDEIEQLAKSAERERIARDLHDVLGHTLSVIAVKSELAAKLVDVDQERAKAELIDIQATARRALAETRETVSGYRVQGLAAELRNARAMLDCAGVVLHAPESVPRLPAQQEASLSLILREAITNIVRHARAQNCHVELETAPEGDLVLQIRDDGCGVSSPEGNGLRGMRERVASLSGVFTIDHASGTVIRVSLPASSAEAPAGPDKPPVMRRLHEELV